jgi:ABC-type transport system involved in multi-copper enzyme maturation permease subunit
MGEPATTGIFMSLAKSGISWLRQTVAWSNSWPSWQERLILALFLVVAVVLGFMSAWLQLWQTAALWAFYLLAIAVCSRQGWLELFGPVLFYDMVRTARRSRYVIMRLLYASVLLAILCLSFFWDSPRDDDRRQTALLAETFFTYFMLVQLTAVVLLTPAYVAGAIAEEKDRKTLEFMLATDLNNHEIILSKLLSRLANLTLFLLTGLPILSILQFVGGVDTQLMLFGFAGTGLTMLGIASVSILFSTLFKKPRDAIGLSYLFIVAYGSLATLGKWLVEMGAPFMTDKMWYGDRGPSLADVSDWINTGNPIAALVDIKKAIAGASLAADLPVLLTNYAYFHGILSLVCIIWSILRLRSIALAQTVGETAQKFGWWESYRPAIGELPMIWKELQVEGRTKLNWLAWCVVILLVMLTVGTGVLIISYHVWFSVFGLHNHGGDGLAFYMEWWFRIAGVGLACLMLLMVVVRASTCISGERDRDTFDALLATPLSAEAILAAKLLGCLTSLRMAWLWFGSMVAIALLTGGIHLLAVPIVIVGWFIYAVFFTMVGMWFSMVCRSSLRASVFSVLTALFLGGGHWVLMGLCCYLPVLFSRRSGPGEFIEYVGKFEFGMTPPFVLALCSYSWENLARHFHRGELFEFVIFSFIGLCLWGMGCLVLWYGILIPKFREITRREELIYQ